MTLPGVAGNLVVAALFTWAVFDAVFGLVASTLIVGHAIRWWRAGLVSLWHLALRVCTAYVRAVSRPALLLLGGSALASYFPSFASWAGAAWGHWAGAALGLLGAAYLAQSSLRGENARAVNRAQVYEMFEAAMPRRPTIRQQTFLKPYRQAHDEQMQREREAAPTASG